MTCRAGRVRVRVPDERVQAQRAVRRALGGRSRFGRGAAVRARPVRRTGARRSASAVGDRRAAGRGPRGRAGAARGQGHGARPGRPGHVLGRARSSPTRCWTRPAYAALRERARTAGGEPAGWPAGDGSVKVSAAWLIERAGFAQGVRHRRAAGVAISSKHTLALTNRGDGTTAALLGAGAGDPRRGGERFGVELHPEPVLVGLRPLAQRTARAQRARSARRAASVTARSSTGQPAARIAPTPRRPALPGAERAVRRAAAQPVERARAGRAPAARARCGGSAPSAAARRASPDCPAWTAGRRASATRAARRRVTQQASRPSSTHVPSTSGRPAQRAGHRRPRTASTRLARTGAARSSPAPACGPQAAEFEAAAREVQAGGSA